MNATRTRFARIALAASVATALAAAPTAPVGAATAGARSQMYRATNHSRTNHEVRRVDIHYRISKLARRHSRAMARKGYIFHTPDPAAKYLDGVDWHIWGENVGVTNGSIAELEAAFMDSPPHRENILDRDFRRVAVGTYTDANGFLWVTIFFYG
jgi:uncharacterized protein YkwD